MMVSVMMASTVAWGSEIKPKTDKPKVMLWATVKAVIVLMATIKFETRKSNPKIKII